MAEDKGKATKKPSKGTGLAKKPILLAALTLVGVGLIQLALAASYLAAFHSPTEHKLPIAIVGKANQVNSIAATLDKKSNNSFRAVVVGSLSQAKRKLESQEVYAIYEPNFPTSTILVASASSKSLAQSLSMALTSFDKAYQEQTRQQLAAQPTTAALSKTTISAPTVVDIAPLTKGDSNGLVLFYVAFSAVFGGYLAAVAINLVRGKRQFSRYAALIRTVGFAIFSVVTSLCIALIATRGIRAVPTSDYLAVAGICALTTFGVSMFASSLVSVLGVAGTALVILIFIVLGTPSSGGPMPVIITGSGPWHLFAHILPTGAALAALRQVVYFHGYNVMSHLWVLIAYGVIGLIVLLGYGIRRSSVSAYVKEIADDVNTK